MLLICHAAAAESVAAGSEGPIETDADALEPSSEDELELQRLREAYAKLLIQHKETLRELSKLRLQAGVLVGEPEAERLGILYERAQGRLHTHRLHEQLYRQIDEFGDYLRTVLEVIEPSDELNANIRQRYGRLQHTVTLLENLPSIVAWRGGDLRTGRNETRVLQVEEEFQFVILAVGRLDQARLGESWRIRDSEGAEVELRVVETENAVSAAIPVSGDLSWIVPGMKAERVQD